jgi:hypothetical protein
MPVFEPDSVPMARPPPFPQFLPQDRVVEFARMDPYQLLEATQKAIGDASLHERHKELIAKSGEVKTATTVGGRGPVEQGLWGKADGGAGCVVNMQLAWCIAFRWQ